MQTVPPRSANVVPLIVRLMLYRPSSPSGDALFDKNIMFYQLHAYIYAVIEGHDSELQSYKTLHYIIPLINCDWLCKNPPCVRILLTFTKKAVNF